eukprot:PITA_09668
MGGARLRFSVACLILMVSIHTFYKENIDAHALLKNYTATSSSPCPKTLRVGVAWKRYFREFVSAGKNGTNPTGFCVKTFEKAIEGLNCRVEYITFGNGVTAPPSYDELIQLIVDKEIDAVVGDMTITANRSQQVEFTQPFLDSSLVAIVRLKDESFIGSALIFMKPFSDQLWLLIAAFFVCGGLAIYFLERRKDSPIQRSPSSSRFGAILMYSFSTWFPNPEDTRSVMGRTVVVACLVVTGILYSCYTANLSAILTASQLEPSLKDIQSVLERQDIKIGYWDKSFEGQFLAKELRISEKRLINLTTEADYYIYMSRGVVDAIIDERPYMQSLVANHCSELAFAGHPFINLNWGFVSALYICNCWVFLLLFAMGWENTKTIKHHRANALFPLLYSRIFTLSRILQLTESGELYTIQNDWLPQYEGYCRNQPISGSIQLEVRQFWGMFTISAAVTVIVLIVNIVRRRCNTSRETDSGTPRRRRFIQLRRRAWPSRLSRRIGTTSETSTFEERKPPDSSECPAV